jgi:hypothetical protein
MELCSHRHVIAVEQLLDKSRLDTTQHLLNGTVGNLGVPGGNGSLENADTLRVLVENGVDILDIRERVLPRQTSGSMRIYIAKTYQAYLLES